MLEKKFTSLLEQADIKINGENPWDMRISSDRVFWSMLLGNLGLGEAYMDNEWDSKQLDEFFYRVLTAGLDKRKYISTVPVFLKFMLINAQKISRAGQVGQRHYDLGNDLFQAMLDSHLQYSCGYWENTDDLEQAQQQKLDLICRKINLQKGERVLDIGCGWGGFAKYAASIYGAKVTGLTISEEQARFAREFCRGLKVEILVKDYREFEGKFDKIVSVGMFEHVGAKNHRAYMEMADRCLKDDGILLLHTIVSLGSKVATDPWIERYIFPNGVLPSIKQIMDAADGIFTARDTHEFGSYYDKTLIAWWRKFDAAWPELKKNPKYDDRFYRMWKYYLLSCAGAFRARKNQLWQLVFSKRKSGIKYTPVR